MRPPPPRLFVLLARESSVAAIVKRGPTHRWTVFRWDTDTDEIERGSTLIGGLHLSRCDLSPDGQLLVYFANYAHLIDTPGFERHGGPGIWTAVSRLPSLVPIVHWSHDDSWSGGGHFVSDRDLRIFDHPSAPAADGVSVVIGPVMVEHEVTLAVDVTRSDRLLTRDGWRPAVEGPAGDHQGPWTKRGQHGLVLERDFGVEHRTGIYRLYIEGVATALMGATWADFDRRGRGLVARHGRISHLESAGDAVRETTVLDFNVAT